MIKSAVVLLLALLVAGSATGVDVTVRSYKARTDFVKLQACPATALNKLPCPGFYIDHKRPLDCGGADTPANMQWLNEAAWRSKSKWERNSPLCEFQTHGLVPLGATPWWTLL
jgi:hypothetical protein